MPQALLILRPHSGRCAQRARRTEQSSFVSRSNAFTLFVQKAKLAHPDVVRNGHRQQAGHFANIVAAYQVDQPAVSTENTSQRHESIPGSRCFRSSDDILICVTCVQVLTDERRRQLYDLSINPRSGNFVKDAAQDSSSMPRSPHFSLMREIANFSPHAWRSHLKKSTA